MSFLTEIWAYIRIRRKLWLVPIVILLLLISGLIVAVQSSALAPFIYSMF